MQIDEAIRIGLQVLDFRNRRALGKNRSSEFLGRGANVWCALAAANVFKLDVERAFQEIDDAGLEPEISITVDQFVEPILPFDQEVQSPFAVFDVEIEQK